MTRLTDDEYFHWVGVITNGAAVIELHMYVIFAIMNDLSYEFAAQIFYNNESIRARSGLLNDTCKPQMTKEESDKLEAALKKAETANKHRNHFAHRAIVLDEDGGVHWFVPKRAKRLAEPVTDGTVKEVKNYQDAAQGLFRELRVQICERLGVEDPIEE